MVSKNNQWQHLQASAQRVPHYGLRKLSVGVASVLLSTTLYMGVSAHADTVTTSSETVTPAAAVPASGSAGTETTGDAAGFSASGLSASLANSNSEATSSQAVPGNSGVTPEKPAGSAADAKAGSETPANNEATNPSSTADRSANPTETPTSTVASDATLKTTLNTTFKWTIHYNDETGNQLRPDSVITHDYTRTDIGDQMGNWSYVPDSVKVTGTPNAGWNINNPTFKFDQTAGGTSFDFATWQAAAATIDGYTPKYGSVAITDQLPKNPESLHGTSTVDSGTHEHTFEYIKQPTKVTINYVDDEQGEKVVGTGTVSGKSGTAVTITPQLPKGYMLTPDKDVPGSYTVTDATDQAVTIHVQKQFVDLSDTDPQAKQTRTITLHYVYGAGDKQGQSAFDDAVLDVYYHRTATLDRATNQTTYGDWLWDQSQGDPTTPGYHVVSGKWTNLPQSWATVTADVPSIKGYYADLSQNDPANTNHVPANTWVFPTYNNAGGGGHTIDGHGATAYLDGQGYEVGPTHTIKYMPNQTTVTVNYVDDDNNGANVGHQSWNGTTGQHIDLTLTPPENYVLTPGWVNPSSYDFDGVNSSWFTVHVKHATQDVTDQQPKDQVTKVTRLTRNHFYGDGPHKGEKFAEPDIFDVAWKRTATKDLVTDKVTFGSWQVNWDDSKNVQGRLTARPTPYMEINGGLYSDKNGYSYKGDNSHSEFVRADGSVKVNVWNKYGWQGAAELEAYPVLNYYYGRDQVKILVKYVDFDTNQQLYSKWLTGDDYLDGNTITFNENDLTTQGAIISIKYQLYTDQTLPTTYKIDTVTNNVNLTPITVYVVKPRTVQFTFTDNDSMVNDQHPQVGDVVSMTGITGSTVPVNLTIPAGYKLAPSQKLPAAYTFTKGETKQVIALVHQHVTVQPAAPKTTTDTLPDNPSKTYPAGVNENDLNKTVTRTITINKLDGSKITEIQTVKLTRTADVDEVTGEVTYGEWSTGQWDAYKIPALKGYTPSQNTVNEVTVTNAMKDQTVNVTYNANQQTLTIRFVDEDLDNNAPDDYLVVGHVLTELDRTITGKTGESFDLNIAIPDHYVFDSTTPFGKKIPKVVAFTPEHGPEVDGDVPFYSFIQNNLVLIPLRHQQIDVSDQHPETKFMSKLTIHQVLSYSYGDGPSDNIDTLFRSSNIGPDYSITTFWRHQFMKDAVTGKVKDMGIVADTTKGDAKTPGMILIGDWQYTPNEISIPKLKFKISPGLALKWESTGVDPAIWHHTDDYGGRGSEAVRAYHIVNDVNGIAEITDFNGFDVNSRAFLGQYKPQEGQNAVAFIIYKPVFQKATIHVIDDDFAEHKTNHDLSINYSWNSMLPETAFSEHQKYRTLSNLVFAGYSDLIYDRSKSRIDKSKLPVYVTTDGDYYIQPDEANEYTVHVRHKHSKVSADQSISDFTVSKYDNLLNGLFGDGDDMTLRYKGLDKSDLNKVVTRTITVISPIDGTKQTINQVANLTRSADVDEATTEVKYDPWTTAKWETYQVPTINGYTPTQSQVIETTVTDSTKDQTVEVTYTANPQTTYVNYVDDSGKAVHTTGLNGKTGQTLKVPVEVPVGWTITKGQVPSEITFGVDGHEPVVITIGHHHVTVDPADPKTPIDPLPDNSTKNYPSGVSENDLNKMVTRTIKVVKVDGITTKEVQTVKLTRNADVDEVTGEVKYGAWTTGQWDAYEVSAVPGYTASQTSVAVTPVDGNTKDQMIDVSYTANSQTTHVNYVDDAGKTVYTTTVTGKTGETVKVPNEVPAGWKLVDGQTVPNEITFGANGHEPVTVKIEHQVKSTQEQKTITRTINYVDAKGAQLKPATVQMLSFARTGMQDLVTNAITWNSTPAQSFAAVNDLAILGYKPDITTVPAVTVNWDDQDSVVDVHYQVANSTVTINLVDAQGHVIATTPVTGQVGSTVDLLVQVPDGWVAYNADIPARVVIGSRPTELDYLIAHRLAFVRSTDGVKAGDLIPGTKTKTFNDQVNADNLVTHASYTVNVWADEAHTRKLVTKTYATDFIRNAVVDAVTGEVYYYSWSEGGKHVFAGFTRPAGDGYQAVVVPAWTATQADPTKIVDLVAQPQQTSGTIQYQTADGTVVSRQTFMGNNAVTLTAPEGYILMTDDAAVMPTLDKNQTYVVYVRPVQTLYTATDKLPEGMESLSKTLTRTIRITEANGHVRTITQRVRFTRTATVKADGSIVYSAWRATGRAAWNKVFLPKRHGYHVVIDGDFAKMNVTADMSDLTVNVKYVKD